MFWSNRPPSSRRLEPLKFYLWIWTTKFGNLCYHSGANWRRTILFCTVGGWAWKHCLKQPNFWSPESKVSSRTSTWFALHMVIVRHLRVLFVEKLAYSDYFLLFVKRVHLSYVFSRVLIGYNLLRSPNVYLVYTFCVHAAHLHIAQRHELPNMILFRFQH